MSNDHPQPLDAAEIPRFAGIPTFMRLPAFTDPAALQVSLIGVPGMAAPPTAPVPAMARARCATCPA